MKLQNLIDIIKVLEKHGSEHVKASVLAESIGVSERQVRRYIGEIKEVFGNHIVSSKDGYILRENPLESLLHWDYDADVAYGAFFATPFADVVKMKKADTISLASVIEMRSRVKKSVLKDLLIALRQGRALKIRHDSKGDIKTHIIYPLKMFFDHGLVYTVCYDEAYEHLIDVQANKIISSKTLNNKLNNAEKREYLEYINKAWGNMVATYPNETRIFDVEFNVNEVIEPFFRGSPLHPSQTINTEVYPHRVKLPVHNLLEFSRFSLRFGKNIKILSPPELISHTKRYLAEMLDYYQSDE